MLFSGTLIVPYLAFFGSGLPLEVPSSGLLVVAGENFCFRNSLDASALPLPLDFKKEDLRGLSVGCHPKYLLSDDLTRSYNNIENIRTLSRLYRVEIQYLWHLEK